MITLRYLANSQGEKHVEAYYNTPFAGNCSTTFRCWFWWYGRWKALRHIALARKFRMEVVEPDAPGT